MVFREWTYEDIYAIAELEKQCFRDAWTYGMLADSFFSENVATIAAEEGGKVVGYGFIVAAGEDADVANIAVDAQFRRKGIAQKILAALEKEAIRRGAKRLFLEVRVSNAAAMALYLKCGFVGKYVRPRYYSDREDALVMEKRLNTQG